MALSIDTADVTHISWAAGGQTLSTSVTCGAGASGLLVVEANSSNGQNASGITYNGVPLTQKFQLIANEFDEVSAWFLASPPTGSAFSLQVTWPDALTAAGFVAIPLIGVDAVAPFGTFASASSAADNDPAVTAVGGVSGDLYIGAANNLIDGQTSSGANQSDIVGAFELFAGREQVLSVSEIPGADTGAFSWTGGGGATAGAWAPAGWHLPSA